MLYLVYKDDGSLLPGAPESIFPHKVLIRVKNMDVANEFIAKIKVSRSRVKDPRVEDMFSDTPGEDYLPSIIDYPYR